MSRRICFLAPVMLAILVGSASAQSASAEAELLQLQQHRFERAMAQDVEALERIMADEIRYCHTSGAVDTKASYLETVRTGGIKWLEIHPRGMEARVHGDVGVIAGEITQTITVGGGEEPIEMHIRTIDVYLKRDGRWQMIEFQASRMREPSL
jgi:hypothetical protein